MLTDQFPKRVQLQTRSRRWVTGSGVLRTEAAVRDLVVRAALLWRAARGWKEDYLTSQNVTPLRAEHPSHSGSAALEDTSVDCKNHTILQIK
ncbi:unnamed protein product [Caretta caretta]